MTEVINYLHFEVLDSTSLYLRKMSGHLQPFTVASADFQTAGRGRGDRKWHSPPGGCAMFSILLDKLPEWDFDTLGALSARTAELIASWLTEKFSVPTTVKHPNDVFVNGRKICGVLIEDASGKLIVGVGLNTNLRPGDVSADIEVESLGNFCGTNIDNRSLIEELAEYLVAGLRNFEKYHGEEKTT